jgi:hypothetical protein
MFGERVEEGEGEMKQSKPPTDTTGVKIMSDAERARVDYATAVATWPDLKSILWRLSQRYSDVLNVTVQGEVEDFLLWVAVDFVNTFANQEPDVEHLCVGILAAEGVVSELVTANWDGLLEAAIKELGYDVDFYRICVQGNDFRGPAAATKLLKFHGCALRAISHEAVYRPLLVARASQIVGWGGNNHFATIRQHMTNVAAQFRTLMVGMSAQDVNIQQLFAAARNLTPWNWTDAAPPHVFAEQEIPITTVAHVREVDAVGTTSAIEKAHAAFLEWRLVPAPKRGELVRLLGEELRANKRALGRLVSIEAGKIESEGLGEVQEMIDICDYAVGLSRQLYGLTIATERHEHRMSETWHPLGVTGNQGKPFCLRCCANFSKP